MVMGVVDKDRFNLFSVPVRIKIQFHEGVSLYSNVYVFNTTLTTNFFTVNNNKK